MRGGYSYPAGHVFLECFQLFLWYFSPGLESLHLLHHGLNPESRGSVKWENQHEYLEIESTHTRCQ